MSDAQGPAGYSLYDLLRTLVERVGWPTEVEKRVALTSIDRAESARLFGNIADQMACQHPEEAMAPSGVCADCGRQVEQTQWTGSGRNSGIPRYQRGKI